MGSRGLAKEIEETSGARAVRDSSTPEAWDAEGGVGVAEKLERGVNTEKGEPVGERAVRDPPPPSSVSMSF